MQKLKNIFKIIIINLVVLAALLAMAEIGMIVLFRDPAAQPGPLSQIYLRYHINYERKIVQFLPECAHYDKELTYTLKPGKCRFTNREFDTELFINSQGLRDDEASLVSPEIVVVGDSFAMGWGVDQGESFARQLEKMTGKVVLNAGISSYGTVREMKMLERIDMRHTRYLIIQYSDNDVRENKVYSGKNNSLPIAEQQEYRKVVAEHARDTRGYRFGLYMYELQKEVVNNLIHTLRRPFMPKEDQTVASDEEAALFVNALKNAHANLKGIKIIVMEINGRACNDSLFSDALKRQIEKPGQPEFIKTMTVLDTSTFLTKDHYFFWDDHLKPEGHKAVADVLAGVLY